MNNKADHNHNASASAVALAPTGSNAGSDNPVPNPIDQAISELAGLNDSAERAVTVFPVVAASDRRRLRLQGFSDADFERDLGQIIALRPGYATGGIDITEVDTLRARRLAVEREVTRLRAILSRAEDAEIEVKRELILQLSVAKSALQVTARHGSKDLRDQLAALSPRVRRRPKPKVKPEQPAAPSGGEPTPRAM